MDDYNVKRPGEDGYVSDGTNRNRILSNTFYPHPKLDICLIRIEADLSKGIDGESRDKKPCLPDNIDLDKYSGVPCWNIGWGTENFGDSYSRKMKQIGLNLMSQNYCTAHRYVLQLNFFIFRTKNFSWPKYGL